MRDINTIVVHGAWTKSGVDVGVEEIREWHVEGNGWSDIGYHYVIRRDGRIEDGRPVERQGAHVQGHNSDTIGICLVGGREDDTPDTADEPEEVKQELLWEFNYTRLQMASLVTLVDSLQAEHGVDDVRGHRDFPGVTKRCPGFDVLEFFRMEQAA